MGPLIKVEDAVATTMLQAEGLMAGIVLQGQGGCMKHSACEFESHKRLSITEAVRWQNLHSHQRCSAKRYQGMVHASQRSTIGTRGCCSGHIKKARLRNRYSLLAIACTCIMGFPEPHFVPGRVTTCANLSLPGHLLII